MKYNLLYTDFYENLKVINEEDWEGLVGLYRQYFLETKSEVMKTYWSWYANPLLPNIDERIYKSCIYIKQNINKIQQIANYRISDEMISRISSKICIKDSINCCEVNMFLGIGACEAFPCLDYPRNSINLAIEALLQDLNIHVKIDSEIIHELSHVIRFNYNLSGECGTLGELLVEEGIACILTRETLKPEDRGMEIEFLNTNNLQNVDTKKLRPIYVEYFDSKEVTLMKNFMNFGDVSMGIVPGAGYVIAIDLLDSFMSAKGLSVAGLFQMNNKEISRNITNLFKDKEI